MTNTRGDALKAWGGDTTQVVETRECLRALGVSVDLVGQEPNRNLSDYDLVHLFNIMTAERGLGLANRARGAGRPLVVSTICWDPRYARHPDNLRFGESRSWAQFATLAPRLALLAQSLRQARGKLRLLRAQRRLLFQAAVILPNSVAELENLVGQFRMPSLRGKAIVVPNAVSLASPSTSAPEGTIARLPDKCVLMAAGFHPIKGQARLIHALMQDREIPLVFVGRDSSGTRYGEHCRSLAARRGNTFFAGTVPHELMPQVYRRAKVHVLPSLRETTGLVSLEAAVCGVNCVVAIHAPVQEYFGLDAFICDPRDPASLRKAVLDAWHAPPNDNLRNRILREFTWERAAQETLRGYQWALCNTSSKRVPAPQTCHATTRSFQGVSSCLHNTTNRAVACPDLPTSPN